MENLDFTAGMDFDENDFCRGYGAETNDDLNEQIMGGFQEMGLAERNDKAPGMSADFYEKFENFLTRGPPKIGETVVNKKKSSEKIDNKESAVPFFPKIVSKTEHCSAPPQPPQKYSKIRSKIENGMGKDKKRSQIDHNLLREAFEYTDKIYKEAILEEAEKNEQPEDGRSNNIKKKNNSTEVNPMQKHQTLSDSVYSQQNPTIEIHHAKKKISNNSTSTMGMVRKLRAKSQIMKTQASASNLHQHHDSQRKESEPNFNVNTEAEIDPKRNAVNFDELILNFQDGTTLKKLRKELEQSKQSMRQSEKFMQELSREYLAGNR